jgi:NAD(P) transhydrogenase
MPDYDYELVVIGGGPAGEKGAAQAAYFGHKTIVIEAYRELPMAAGGLPSTFRLPTVCLEPRI